MVAQGIRIRGVRKVFGGEAAGTVALDRIDLDIAAAEFVSVVGPSGCGKSTLLRLIAGLIPASAGEISVLGPASARSGSPDMRHRLPAAPILLDWRTAPRERAVQYRYARSRSRRATGCKALQLLAAVGLRILPTRPYELSGGMRQRVAIARALCMSRRCS